MRYLAAVIMLLYGQVDCAAAAELVPLADMLTTSGQEGMQQVGETFQGVDDPANKSTNGYLHKIYEASGPSDVFLVDATTMHEAVSASASVFVGSRSASTPAPVNKQNPLRGNLWLVAYLGKSHSSPMRWVVDSATVTENKIRLAYREPQWNIGTSDSMPYLYWIPLGKIEPGIYEVELFDADEKAVILMRRVKVE